MEIRVPERLKRRREEDVEPVEGVQGAPGEAVSEEAIDLSMISNKPGVTLRKAREAMSLTAPDIAAKLHLDHRVIAALEADDYEQLAAPAYVRGYIRSYAALVKTDAEPLVETFNLVAGQGPALHPSASKPVKQLRSGDKPMLITTALVVLTVIALAAIWWHSHDSVPADDALAPAASDEDSLTGAPVAALPAPPPLPEVAPGAPGTPGAVGGLALPAAPGSAAPAPTPPAALSPAGAPPADALTASTPTPAEGGAPAAGATADTAAPVPAGDTDPAAEAQAAGAPPDAAPPPPAPGEGRLELRIGDAEVWIEVLDAGAERLYAGTAQPRSTVAVEGRLPMRAIIGRMRHVEALYNGELLDLQPYAYNGVARFSLGAEGISQ